MKKIRFYILLILIFSFKLSNAQYSINVDSLIRDLLIPLTPPSPQSPFLFEMSAHSIDDNYFSHTNNIDTFNSNIWYSIYSEMRNAAYDTSILQNSWGLRYKAMNHKKNNVIPVGLIYANYHKLIDSVFTDSLKGVYFDWDDDDLWDVSSRTSSPYLNKTLFVASILENHTHFKTVKFVIDSTFIFYSNTLLNPSNSINPNLRLAIDFGDGLGYKLFRLDTITNYTVSYPDSGEYIIKFALATPNNEGSYTGLTYLSKSYLYVASPETPQVFEHEIIIPGLTVTYMLGCDNVDIRKPLIYLEGIDYFEDRHADKIYSNSIRNPRVVELLNYGYDLIIVDWKNSKADLRSNAMRVVHLIDELKCHIEAPDESNELFVLMGESMGGLIGRMALAYMESDDYQSTTPNGLPYHLSTGEDPPAPGECSNSTLDLKARKHNTRLFVSIDAPHQGAISPIGIQLMYKYFSFENAFVQELQNYTSSMHEVYFNAKFHLDNVTSSYAAKQMLIQELSTGISSKEYTSNPLRDEFLETLYSLPNESVAEVKKGYPQECKLVAISNGLLTQQNQQKVGNLPANDGDEILHIFLDIRSTVLGFIKAKRHQYDMHIYTVSNSNSPVFTSDKLESKFKFRGCLRGFFKRTGSCYKIEVTKSEVFETKDVPPLEVNSGGNVYIMPPKNKIDKITPKMDYFIFGYGLNVDYANGNVNLEAKYLLDIITMKNVTFNFQTDACFINHIPLHSALDFDKKRTLGWDYQLFIDHSDPGYSSYINNNFDLTPFDVYYSGVNTDFSNPYASIDYFNASLDKNTDHVEYRIFNENSTGPRSVNLEIGDSHMYLENFKIVSNSIFWPAYEVNAGSRNPQYSYDNNPNSLHMYSRSGRLDWNNKSVILKSNVVTLNTSNIINIEDRTIIEEEGYDPCTVVYRSILSESNETEKIEELIEEFVLYPNPNNGKFHIKLSEIEKLKSIELYNSVGMKISNFDAKINDSKLDVNLSFDLEPGFYYIRINLDNNINSIPLILNR